MGICEILLHGLGKTRIQSLTYRVLNFRSSQSITNGNTSQIQYHGIVRWQFLVVCKDTMGNGRCVVSTIRFANNVEWIGRKFGMLLKKLLQEPIRVFRNHIFVGVCLFTIRKANTGGLIKPQDVSCLRPGIWIKGSGGSVGIDLAWSIFSQESSLIEITFGDACMLEIRQSSLF
jgi:hypothetical protein